MKKKEKVTNEGLEDLLFWEELKDITEQIETMNEEQRKDYLFEMTKRELTEGRSWQRNLIKRILLFPDKRQDLLNALKRGDFYKD